MKYLMILMSVFIALTFSAIAADESTEKQESACDDSVHYGDLSYISIAEIQERIVSLSWPKSPSLAEIVGTAVFQIKVSTSGEVCSIESIGGQTIVLAMLKPEVKKWKFRPDRPFWGIVAIRYTTSRGFRFL